MLALTQALSSEAEYRRLLNAVDMGGCPVLMTGMENVHRAHIAAGIRRDLRLPLFFIAPDEAAARRYAADLSALTGEEADVLGGRDFTFYNAEGVSRELEQRRISTLHRLAEGRAPVCVASAEALLLRSLAPDKLRAAAMTLKMGGSYGLDGVVRTLENAGYKRSSQVEGGGQYARRGGILDFFSPAMTRPVRCEFFGDEIDSMGMFDTDTQRRVGNIVYADILPAAEALPSFAPGGEEGLLEALRALKTRVERRKSGNAELIKNLEGDIERLENGRGLTAADRYMDLIYDDTASAADYIPADAVVVLAEPGRIRERARSFLRQNEEDVKALIENGVIEGSVASFTLAPEEVEARLGGHAVVMLDSFTQSDYPMRPRTLLSIQARQLPGYGGSLETAVDDIRHYTGSGHSVIVLAADERRARGLKSMLDDAGIASALDFLLAHPPEGGGVAVGVGSLSAGMEYPGAGLAVVTEGQLAASPVRRSKSRRGDKNRQKLNSYADLSPGDLVVHEHHGIGRFVGIFPMDVDGNKKDYIKIAYQGKDSLYVPATQLDLVSKYIGGGEDKPVKLSKLGGSDWSRAKSRAKGAAREMARELIALYAERARTPGYAFAPDSVWQTEFEDAFGYTETDDQLKCIEEIKADMQKSVPMDRLLCGDVGYGKTEVALRAAMKCILDGKQAAMLVPTTVLAQQHGVTAIRRFAKYPVKIEVLSRFRTAAQLKQTLRGLQDGSVDLVIGTHKLLQKDVKFKDLGLLIVDEEQRFGVAHKERLKEISRNVDVLTLSATPIPRTLNMALSGIRDMSLIEEPPQDRQPVQTYVLEHDWSVVGDAMRRELSRGGQVYYLHNRIDSIDRAAAKVAAACEGAVIATAHGRMPEDELNEVMERVSSGEIQVLVCTTIIETGIDIPNVNTLIIEDADRLGLAQLHQIRGRVGRSSRRAFAYLTFRQGKVLTEEASKRLAAIREFAEFNSGFRIAMRDLEIRGAGNLLGSEQSGQMISVGYDMYLKLLEEAVLEERGEKPRVRTDCAADLAVSANIPERYVPSAEQRMDLYRRIAAIRSEEDADDLTDELIDRYGEPPKPVNTLIHVALLRGSASRAGITEISQKSGWLCFKLGEFEPSAVAAICAMPELKDKIRVEMATEPMVRMRIKNPGAVIAEAVSFVEYYASAQPPPPREQTSEANAAARDPHGGTAGPQADGIHFGGRK